jgi:hypothetical protein
MTDFVATSMGLAFQDASPIFANQALAAILKDTQSCEGAFYKRSSTPGY